MEQGQVSLAEYGLSLAYNAWEIAEWPVHFAGIGQAAERLYRGRMCWVELI